MNPFLVSRLESDYSFTLLGSGTIGRYELRTVLESCMKESSLHFGSEEVDELTEVLFLEAGVDSDGEITFDDFQTALENHPGLIGDLSFR